MKTILIAFFAVLSVLPACSQEKRNSPHETVKSDNVSVTYGRPYKKNREVFGKLVPFGQVWRAGADEATEIMFAKDGSIGGKPVKAGTYTMFVVPNEKEWTIILNSKLKQWGSYDYEKIKGDNVVEVNAPVEKLSSLVEQFTIHFNGGNMIFEWDNVKVGVPVK